MSIVLRAALILLLLCLSQACSEDSAYILKPQWWQDVEVMVEIRPSVPRAGMNEFLVVATQKNRRPAFDLIVSLKTEHGKRWEQSIQDGHSGVYRRAIWVQDPKTDVLLVQLQRGEERGELRFPLTLTMAGSAGQSRR